MKVKELIEKLSIYNPEAAIVVPGNDHSYRIATLREDKAEICNALYFEPTDPHASFNVDIIVVD